MDRRTYLTTLGAAAVAVSGCSGGDGTATTDRTGTDDGTATPTARATGTSEQTPAEQTPTEEPPDPTPSVTDAGLLLGSGRHATLGDIDSVGQGGPLVVGVEYDLPASGDSARGLVEVRVRDTDGTEQVTDSTEIDAVVAGDSEFHSDSSSFAFDTTDWEQGSYTAEVLVHSESYGTRASTEVSAEVVEPLGEGEVEMYLAGLPDDPVAGEEFALALGFRNLTDRDSSLVTDTVTFDPARRESVTFSSEKRKNIAANDQLLAKTTIGVPYPGRYTYRLREVGAEVSFAVGAPEE